MQLRHYRHLQSLIYTAIFLAVTLIFISLKPNNTPTVRSIYLPNSQPSISEKPQNPNQVSLFTTMPSQAKSLGLIRTMVHFDSTDPIVLEGLFKSSVLTARQLAANFQADGLVIQTAGTNSQTPNVLDGFVVYATPIQLDTGITS